MIETNTARVDRRWLAARRLADERARSAADPLVDDLAAFLDERRGAGPAHLVDVGAGTGMGASWLYERLRLPQDWVLIDHDADLLAASRLPRQGWARTALGDAGHLREALQGARIDALTCQALLDLLMPDTVRALLAPVLEAGAAVLAGLTVTGRVDITPPHDHDELVTAAFNAHQRRAGRLGPNGADYAADILEARGYTVRRAPTPWRLTSAERPLLDAWLRGRASAAAEQAPHRTGQIDGWLTDRLATLCSGRLSARVDHVDVLGLPPHEANCGPRTRTC